MIDIIQGDAIASLKNLPDQSVHTCVTSPPYFGLRDYGVEGQIGLEPTPDEFVAAMVAVFREVRRVLRDEGTLWLNLGDSYAQSGGAGTQGSTGQRGGRTFTADGTIKPKNGNGLKPKDLIGIPWRVAFALQADGWYLRQDIIWAKPNPMPESVRDRCTKSHEYIFLLSKGPKYFFDHEAIKEPATGRPPGNKKPTKGGRNYEDGVEEHRTAANLHNIGARSERNKRSVWTVTTKPFKESHFATFPPDLIEPCVVAGSPEKCCSVCGAGYARIVEKGEPDLEHQRACGGDVDGKYDGKSTKDYAASKAQDASATKARILAGMVKKVTVGFEPTCTCPSPTPIGGTVLDPFFGAGTTGLVASKHGRNCVGIELNPEYVGIAKRRLGIFDLLAWMVAA